MFSSELALLEKAEARLANDNGRLEAYPGLAKRMQKIRNLYAEMQAQDDILDTYRKTFAKEEDYIHQVRKCLDGDFKKIRPLSRTELLFDLRKTLESISRLRLQKMAKKKVTSTEKPKEMRDSLHDLTGDFGPEEFKQDLFLEAKHILCYLLDLEQRLATLNDSKREKIALVQTFDEQKRKFEQEIEEKTEKLRQRCIFNLRLEATIEALNKEVGYYKTCIEGHVSGLKEQREYLECISSRIECFIKGLDTDASLETQADLRKDLTEARTLFRELRKENQRKEKEFSEGGILTERLKVQLNKCQSGFQSYDELPRDADFDSQIREKKEEMMQKYASLSNEIMSLEREKELLNQKRAGQRQGKKESKQILNFKTIQQIKHLTELEKSIERKKAKYNLLQERKAIEADVSSDLTFVSLSSISSND